MSALYFALHFFGFVFVEFLFCFVVLMFYRVLFCFGFGLCDFLGQKLIRNKLQTGAVSTWTKRS